MYMYGGAPFLHIWEKESVEDNNAIKAIEKETLKKTFLDTYL